MKKSIEIFESFLTSAIKYFKWFVVAAVVMILLTGVYNVNSNEVAVVLRFGALTGTDRQEQVKQPGLHFALPNFIDEVIKIPVEKVQEMNISTLNTFGETVSGNIARNGYAITGDSNILLLNMAVKYKISDPVAYALYVNNSQDMLTGIICSEMTSLVSKTPVDNVLTTEKNSICSKTMKNSQSVIDSLSLGLTITNIELTGIAPPPEAKSAFDNATTASVRKQTLIQQAMDYRESAIPQAEAYSQTLINTARSDQSSRVAAANQIAQEFNGLYKQFEANPDVVKNGIFRSRIGTLISRSGKTVVISDENGNGSKVVLP